MRWLKRRPVAPVDEVAAVDELRRTLVDGRRVAARELRVLAATRWSMVAPLVLGEVDRLEADADRFARLVGLEVTGRMREPHLESGCQGEPGSGRLHD